MTDVGTSVSLWGKSVYILRKSLWGSMAVTGLEDSNGEHKEYSSHFIVNSNWEVAFLKLSDCWSEPSHLPERPLRSRISICYLRNNYTDKIATYYLCNMFTRGLLRNNPDGKLGLRITKKTTHPKKSAWSDVPYREGESISSGYSVSLVLSVPSPIAAMTKRTGRMTWAMKPLTSRRVWWNLLMNKADVFLSSNGKPCRLLDLIRSWSGYKRRTRFVMDQ